MQGSMQLQYCPKNGKIRTWRTQLFLVLPYYGIYVMFVTIVTHST